MKSGPYTPPPKRSTCGLGFEGREVSQMVNATSSSARREQIAKTWERETTARSGTVGSSCAAAEDMARSRKASWDVVSSSDLLPPVLGIIAKA